MYPFSGYSNRKSANDFKIYHNKINLLIYLQICFISMPCLMHQNRFFIVLFFVLFVHCQFSLSLCNNHFGFGHHSYSVLSFVGFRYVRELPHAYKKKNTWIHLFTRILFDTFMTYVTFNMAAPYKFTSTLPSFYQLMNIMATTTAQ